MSTLSTPEALADAREFCTRILPHVSRTFALTIPVLDEPLREQVGTAYLLCRIADTIEDRTDLLPETRRKLFEVLLRLVSHPDRPTDRELLQRTWPRHPDPHHENLVRHADRVLDCYRMFPDPARQAIADCIEEMVGGMSRYPAPTSPTPVEVCSDLDELETYCHFVAGTVGILLSNLFAGELSPGWLTSERIEQGRQFGLGLQLTNVLKDHQGDRTRGISYVPGRWMDETGTLTGEGTRVLVGRALEHLDAAHAYVLALPSTRADMRVFCLWAAHLALATLRLVARRSQNHEQPAKVSRDELWTILEKTRNLATDDAALGRLHAELRGAVEKALPA
jgi:farnesyl-diphosphate farnesyltransferase